MASQATLSIPDTDGEGDSGERGMEVTAVAFAGSVACMVVFKPLVTFELCSTDGLASNVLELKNQ